MRKFLLFPLILAAPASIPAQTAPRTVDVRLSSFDYTPEAIHLRAGQPVVLRLINTGRGGHNFSAPQFFAAANVAAGQNVAISEGTIEVPSRQTVAIRLTPARGTYRLRCTHRFHSTLGMRGQIIVE
jgi:plastocyanin